MNTPAVTLLMLVTRPDFELAYRFSIPALVRATRKTCAVHLLLYANGLPSAQEERLRALASTHARCTEFHDAYLHYGGFAKNVKLADPTLALSRSARIGAHNGWIHLHRRPHLARRIRAWSQRAYLRLGLVRYDRLREQYCYQQEEADGSGTLLRMISQAVREGPGSNGRRS